jgi:hypothetical protein
MPLNNSENFSQGTYTVLLLCSWSESDSPQKAILPIQKDAAKISSGKISSQVSTSNVARTYVIGHKSREDKPPPKTHRHLTGMSEAPSDSTESTSSMILGWNFRPIKSSRKRTGGPNKEEMSCEIGREECSVLNRLRMR